MLNIKVTEYQKEEQLLSQKEEQLQSLNMPEETLRTALLRGLSSRRSMTKNNPKTGGGQYFYNETVRALRELLKDKGFVGESIRNIELTINQDLGVAIYLCSGCNQTGLKNGTPQSKTSKGDFTLDLFNLNQIESPNYDMFEELIPKKQANNAINCEIWFLLHYFNKDNNSLMAELTKPISFNSKGYVTGFDRENRIIIDLDINKPIDIDDSTLTQSFNADIDIPIELKI
ncbi:hypothetical protein [Photobacterium lucens]|uniref:hypothetical protein n=1 Tax=Photobacterium lucens TaxID=2562949 RepID=UPI001368D294|nr:hypothetical protein [Photobacterium lucens]MBP2699507.1 hypothetical protein [Vibrio parahaemolyticus]MZG56980.1 hypothetical protein [Photobacterium lucens]MZG82978.1 hypothetical protein [Photobacterium lucens]